jgi:hypothetical protein
MKDFLTTKLTKGSDHNDFKLRVPFDLAQGMLRAFVVKSVSLFGGFFESGVTVIGRRL